MVDGPMHDQWAHPDTAATREQDRGGDVPVAFGKDLRAQRGRCHPA